ncbi:hypothetical protein AVEN_225580-1 [Araneus ventricosus]|uniref:Uncharacterized protein n=1 Tax=Araneus ventricosus TaxID=182803 RepID=A0A4Y2MM04_ARAVE|nr:hypothetical protein AVEN_225580-1 [Araneus ventricosus]
MQSATTRDETLGLFLPRISNGFTLHVTSMYGSSKSPSTEPVSTLILKCCCAPCRLVVVGFSNVHRNQSCIMTTPSFENVSPTLSSGCALHMRRHVPMQKSLVETYSRSSLKVCLNLFDSLCKLLLKLLSPNEERNELTCSSVRLTTQFESVYIVATQ